ncbi:unnamed protein product [Ambrosiozyma monospora]|uniref:Unnamed protein product n=1 Tax=Ambrosiozyma monospora TaxID=43982 RepID=A0ACB5SZ38_AMBMO|nr:unnamed protein product [Ambrosiozyma monospora]
MVRVSNSPSLSINFIPISQQTSSSTNPQLKIMPVIDRKHAIDEIHTKQPDLKRRQHEKIEIMMDDEKSCTKNNCCSGKNKDSVKPHGFHMPTNGSYSTLKFHKKLNANDGEEEPSSFEKELVDMSNSGKRTAAKQIWARPSIPEFDIKDKDIEFQQLDAEETFIGEKSAARFFGVTKEGYSVLCNVTGFAHYLYVPVPKGLSTDDLHDFKKYLREGYQGIVDVEIVEKESIWGFNNNTALPFLKVIVDNVRFISKVRYGFERGEIQYKDLFPPDGSMTFDNVQYLLRLMIDCKITGMGWLTAPAGKYSVISKYRQVSTCQLEITIDYKDLMSHPSEGKYLSMAPLRILSFDIECAGRKGIFPEAEHDSVIQIANVVSKAGDPVPFVRNVFTVKSCAPIVGSEIFSYEDEGEMLRKWKDFIVQVDPDVIIGYNIANFDLPYLLNRAIALGVRDFPYFSRLKSSKQEVKDSVFSSRAYGTRENKVVNIEERRCASLYHYSPSKW